MTGCPVSGRAPPPGAAVVAVGVAVGEVEVETDADAEVDAEADPDADADPEAEADGDVGPPGVTSAISPSGTCTSVSRAWAVDRRHWSRLISSGAPASNAA